MVGDTIQELPGALGEPLIPLESFWKLGYGCTAPLRSFWKLPEGMGHPWKSLWKLGSG